MRGFWRVWDRFGNKSQIRKQLKCQNHTFTSKLPDGWESRLVEICNENTNDVSGLCLEIHDLIVSKLYAGRQKDIEFFRAATNLGLISKGTLTERINKTSISGVRKDMIESYIKKEFSQ